MSHGWVWVRKRRNISARFMAAPAAVAPRKMPPQAEVSAARSEYQLQCELPLPGRVCRTDRAEGGARDLRVRNAEIGVVQNVEELRPELQPRPLPNVEVLVDGEIPLVELGRTKRIAPHIAERRVGRRNRECVAREIRVQHRRAALVHPVTAYVRPQEGLPAIVVGKRADNVI